MKPLRLMPRNLSVGAGLKFTASHQLTDLQPGGDFGFADARTVQFSNLVGLESRCDGPAEFLPTLPGVHQGGPHPFRPAPFRTRRRWPAGLPWLDRLAASDPALRLASSTIVQVC